MGESKPVRVARAVCVAALVAAAATALTSCSALGMTPGSAVASASGPVLDPSIPSATPSDTVASDTPAPSATAVVTAAPAVTPSVDARTAVVPFINTHDWDAATKTLYVSALVQGVTESGGTCTTTITSGATSVTAKAQGVAASSYTGCQAVTFKDLATGSWQIRVRYDSPKATGSSPVVTVPVG